jgi:hypothetical protein
MRPTYEPTDYTHTHTHGHLGVNDKTTVCMFKEEKRIPTERNIRPARLSLMRRGPHSQESAALKRRFVKIQVFPTGLLHVCMCVCVDSLFPSLEQQHSRLLT